jgi:hypothetical protein
VVFFQECTECPGSDKLQYLPENLPDENSIEDIIPSSRYPNIHEQLK